MSAQKAFQGSETEELGGAEENSVSSIKLIYHKNETENIELVARPWQEVIAILIVGVHSVQGDLGNSRLPGGISSGPCP